MYKVINFKFNENDFFENYQLNQKITLGQVQLGDVWMAFRRSSAQSVHLHQLQNIMFDFFH